jgi:hypothetical protein
MSELLDVTVKVPAERIPDFYSMYGAWLSGSSSKESAESLQPWTEDDQVLANHVWARLSPVARKLFETLWSAHTRTSASELAKRLGLGNEFVVAGALAWPGRHSYAVGRKLPVAWEENSDGSFYWMEQVPGELFKTAKKISDNLDMP